MGTRSHLLFLFLVVCLLPALLPLELGGRASAQVVITAPDKGDELEARAYVEAQGELKEEIRLRDPNATIDIDVYTCVLAACGSTLAIVLSAHVARVFRSVSEPTQYVIGLILDPCRDHAADCCSDRFGEPVRAHVHPMC